MKIGVLRIASQAPFFMGVEKGYFAEAGIDAELVFFDAAVPATLAIASRDVDLAVIGFTPRVLQPRLLRRHGRHRGPQPRAVRVSRTRACSRRTRRGMQGVRTMADMKGRVIGLTTIGSTNHYAVARIGEKYGFDVNENHLVPAQGLGNLAAMLMGNQVDVASGAGTAFMGLIVQGSRRTSSAGPATRSRGSRRALRRTRASSGKTRGAASRSSTPTSAALRSISAVLLDKNGDGSYKDPAKAEELLALISRWTSVPLNAIAQSLAIHR